MTTEHYPKVCIYGAGSIGCYVGGRLQAAGVPVSFIGRERIAAQVREHGLHLSNWQGTRLSLAPDKLAFHTDEGHTDDSALEGAELVIVTVKSAATEEVGETLRERVSADTVVLSLQNGVDNASSLRGRLPGRAVLAGMISFNVIQQGEGRFHAGTEGELMSEPHPVLDKLLPAFREGELPLELRDDMREVLWAKLLLNMSNPVNALSGVTLYEQLSRRDYRRCMALLIHESLAVLEEAGIRPARLLPVPMTVVARMLTVPDWVFRLLARRMLQVDPLARSSMWEDLEAGRRTEVDWINGAVLKLAEAQGMHAPRNEKIVALMREAEQGGKRNWAANELLHALREAN